MKLDARLGDDPGRLIAAAADRAVARRLARGVRVPGSAGRSPRNRLTAADIPTDVSPSADDTRPRSGDL